MDQQLAPHTRRRSKKRLIVEEEEEAEKEGTEQQPGQLAVFELVAHPVDPSVKTTPAPKRRRVGPPQKAQQPATATDAPRTTATATTASISTSELQSAQAQSSADPSTGPSVETIAFARLLKKPVTRDVVSLTTATTVVCAVKDSKDNGSSIAAGSNGSIQQTTDENELLAFQRYLSQTTLRESTQAVYLVPLNIWKAFCEENPEAYDPVHIYTVGPPAKVHRFFKDVVFKRTHSKYIRTNTDTRVPIGIGSDQGHHQSQGSAMLKQMVEAAPLDSTGTKKILRLPNGSEAVKQFRKVLMRLYDYQCLQRSIEWPSPKSDQELKNLMSKYTDELLYGHLQTNQDRAAHCVIRDSYKPRQLVIMLKSLWCSDVKGAGGRKAMRDLLYISARHHMLLRSEDLRHLNFSDCFSTVISRKQHRGSQQAVALVFSKDRGKTLQQGEVAFACALRHEVVTRCAFSAFAFYMFELFQKGAPFLNDGLWYLWKVVPSRSDPKNGLSSQQLYEVTRKALQEQNIFTSRVTHGGRHAGSMEVENFGVPLDIIKQGGNWKDKLGRLETHYLGKLPSQFARGMAGFWNKPFGIPRNQVKPPPELQRTIFPWIEGVYSQEDIVWKKSCLEEMDEIDDNEDYTDSLDYTNDNNGADGNVKDVNGNVGDEINIIMEMDNAASTSASAAVSPGKREPAAKPVKNDRTLYQDDDMAKRGFLKLLVRCRRIILQDAAALLHAGQVNKLLRDDVFQSSAFKEFLKEVIAVLENPEPNPLEGYEQLVPTLVESQNTMTTRFMELNRAQERNELQRQQKEHRQQVDFREMQQQMLLEQQRLRQQQEQWQQQQWQQWQQEQEQQQILRQQQQLLLFQQQQCIQQQMSLLSQASRPNPCLTCSPQMPSVLPVQPATVSTAPIGAPSGTGAACAVVQPPMLVPQLMAPIPPPMPPQLIAPRPPQWTATATAVQSPGAREAKWIPYDPQAKRREQKQKSKL